MQNKIQCQLTAIRKQLNTQYGTGPNLVKVSTQLLPGDPVLYYNKGTNQLVSGYYSSVFTSKFGPPVARDVQNPKYTKQVFFMGSDNFFVNAALKFSQAANFVKVDNSRDIDLL